MAKNIAEITENLFQDLDSQRKALNGNLSTAFKDKSILAKHNWSRLSFPTKREEEWKYTSLEKAFNSNFRLAESKSKAVQTTEIEGVDAHKIVLNNGRLVSIDDVKGLTVQKLSNAEHPGFGHLAKTDSHYFNALNGALINEAILIRIEANSVIEKPILLINQVDGNEVLGLGRIVVHADRNCDATLIELNKFSNGSGLINRVAEISVDENAHLEHVMIQDYLDGQSALHTTEAIVKRSGNYTNHVATFGGQIIRNELNIQLADPNCECHLNGLYLLDGKSHVDNHTLVDHQKPNCESNEFYKGVMSGKSTGVFNGKVYVQQEAQKTNAYQQNRNLLLSDEATINTKPQLEIWADDVKCSHGATVGQLDEAQMFYMKARGINDEMARSLMIYAFASEVIEKIRNEGLRNHLFGIIKSKLNFSLV